MDDSLKNPLDLLVDDLERIWQLARIHRAALKYTRNRFDEMKPWKEEDWEPLQREWDRMNDILRDAKSEVDAGFPLLYDVATVRLWTALDCRVKEYIRRVRKQWPDIILKKPDKKPGISMLQQKLAPFGLAGDTSSDLETTIRRLHAFRDVLTHRDGVVDQLCQQMCADPALTIGTPIIVSAEQFEEFRQAVRMYEETLREKLKRKGMPAQRKPLRVRPGLSS